MLWRGSTRVTISDPARTLVDIIAMPETGGGIDHVADCVATYLGTRESDRKLTHPIRGAVGQGMIDKREILESASALGLLPSVAEKDYVLGWLLAGINAHPVVGQSWVFKGGTCLKSGRRSSLISQAMSDSCYLR